MRSASELLDISRACRIASGAYAVELGVLASKPGTPSADVADLCLIAVHLQEASDHLASAATDARGLAIAAHLAAGGDIIMTPPARPVVVRQDGDAPRAANLSRAQRVAVVARSVLRFVRRA